MPGDGLLYLSFFLSLPLSFQMDPLPLASSLTSWVLLLVMASLLGNFICGLWGLALGLSIWVPKEVQTLSSGW